MSGHCETSDLKSFSYGVANRGASVRIPRLAEANQRGYLEDRRPASNMDPYVITSALADITILGGVHLDSIVEKYKQYIATLKQ